MTWIIAVALFAAGDAPAATGAAATIATAPSFDAFFADFAKKRDAIRYMEARFTQKNISPEDTVDSAGSVVYVKPRRILFRYDKPDSGATYLVYDQKAYEYEPDVKQLQIYNLEDNPQTEIFFLGFDDNTAALRDAYDVDVFQSDGKGGAYGIAIRPKKKEGSANFKEVRLYLRDADDLPYRIHIENEDESEVNINISDFAVNGKLDPAKARIALPEGTKIIDNDQLVETVGPEGKSVPASDAAPASGAAPTAASTPRSVAVEELPPPAKADTAETTTR
jgi:outer membrane lipoprotein-sorting protein